jgi:flavin-dependent dehydrogenase
LDYLKALQLDYEPDALRFHAHPLPIGAARIFALPRRQILLAGDAAGLINPFFGDGILYAVKSGIMAAECVVEGTTLEYSDRIHTKFATNFDAALRMANFFYQFPGFCYRYGVTNPRATRAAARLIAGEFPFDQLPRRVLHRVRRQALGSLLPMQGARSSG